MYYILFQTSVLNSCVALLPLHPLWYPLKTLCSSLSKLEPIFKYSFSAPPPGQLCQRLISGVFTETLFFSEVSCALAVINQLSYKGLIPSKLLLKTLCFSSFLSLVLTACILLICTILFFTYLEIQHPSFGDIIYNYLILDADYNHLFNSLSTFSFPSKTIQCQSPHVCAKLLQLCPTLCNPVDRSLLGSSVHGILQERILQ